MLVYFKTEIPVHSVLFKSNEKFILSIVFNAWKRKEFNKNFTSRTISFIKTHEIFYNKQISMHLFRSFQ